jgi:hypothetical protein
MTYRYYSVGQVGTEWRILGWSRDQQHAGARKGTRYWAYAGTREQAARLLKAEHGIDVYWKKF